MAMMKVPNAKRQSVHGDSSSCLFTGLNVSGGFTFMLNAWLFQLVQGTYQRLKLLIRVRHVRGFSLLVTHRGLWWVPSF